MEHEEFVKKMGEVNAAEFKQVFKKDFEDLTIDQRIVAFDRMQQILDNEVHELIGDREVIGFCENCSMPVFDSEKHIYDSEGVVIHKVCSVLC